MKNKSIRTLLLVVLLGALCAQPAFALTASQIATAAGKQLTNNQCTGTTWFQNSLVKPVHLVQESEPQGCLLAQMTGARTLKAQRFQGAACSKISGFTSNAVTYER